MAQCRHWLEKNLPNAELSEATSTSKAAEIASITENSAAISSKLAATRCNIKILKEGIQGNPNNFTKLFESENARVIECTAIEHDNAMAAVQVLSHLTLASLKKTMQELSAENITAFSSPVFEKLCELIERTGKQNPELYPSIFLNNKHSLQVAKALQDNVGFFKKLIEKKDFEGLKKFYERLSEKSKN